MILQIIVNFIFIIAILSSVGYEASDFLGIRFEWAEEVIDFTMICFFC